MPMSQEPKGKMQQHRHLGKKFTMKSMRKKSSPRAMEKSCPQKNINYGKPSCPHPALPRSNLLLRRNWRCDNPAADTKS